MRLVEGLQITAPAVLAIVGAGGKTTTLFRLAREIEGPVFVTTTTHLGVEQGALADRHVILSDSDNFLQFLHVPNEKVTLFSGEPTSEPRLPGIGKGRLETLCEFCLERKVSLLIEADGARGLPLKAPTSHEPAIPEWVNAVILVAGMQGLGKPLTAEYVHRPEQFSRLSGLGQGERITPEAISKVMLDPEGGLKNIPAGARQIVLLNQADSDELKAHAGKIAGTLTEKFHATLVGALRNEGKDEIAACYKPIGAIILAAGAAERYGRPKPLLEWQGETFIRRIARTAMEAGLSPVIVVTGRAGDEVASAVAGMPVPVAFNPDWQTGQASSVKTGLKALPATCGAAVFLLADQPQVTPTILTAELEVHRKSLPPVVAPLIDSRRANPVLFDRVVFSALNEISGDSGGRQVFGRFPVTWLEWNDMNLLLDVDTPQDYARLLELK